MAEKTSDQKELQSYIDQQIANLDALEAEKSYLTSDEYKQKREDLERIILEAQAMQEGFNEAEIAERLSSERIGGDYTNLGSFHDYAGVYANKFGRGLGNMLSYAGTPFVYLWRGFTNLPVINKMHFLTDAMRNMMGTVGAIPAATMRQFKEAYRALVSKTKKDSKKQVIIDAIKK